MKLETVIFDYLKKTIPEGAEKTILFANVADTDYELFFYSTFKDGTFHQCYTLAENDILDSNLLDYCFSKIVERIKLDKKYKVDKKNVFTFVVDDSGVNLDVEYYEKDARMYKIKKIWKEKYLA